MGRTRRTLLTGAVALGLLAASLVLGAGGPSAGRVDPPGQRAANHCVTASGVDLNALFGVTDQIVTRFCAEVSAGEHWRPFGFWIVNGLNEAFPAGYVPSGSTPIEDFVAKLVAVKIVVDGGTSWEKTFIFAPSEVLRANLTADELEPGFPAVPMAATLPRMTPLSIGEHTRELVWVLSAMHCDGFGASVDENCLPAGDVSFGVSRFTVTTPEA